MSFENFNDNIDWGSIEENLKAKPKKEESKKEFKEIPDGNYFVDVERLELRESKNGNPMVSAMFRIKEGEFANQCMFMNQVVTNPVGLEIALKFLQSLECDGVGFDSIKSYDDVAQKAEACYECIVENKYYYEVEQKTNDKGFKSVFVVDSF